MKDLLLSKHTLQELERYLLKPSHAVILVGSDGMGKEFVATHMSASLLGKSQESLENYPYFLKIVPSKGSISIDEVRSLQKFLQLRTVGKEEIRRVIVISDAHQMTIEAQNSLLKILEEPPKDTCLILTADGENLIRPTIYSRAQTIRLVAPNLDESMEFFSKEGYSDDIIKRSYLLSGGNTALLASLLRESVDHPLTNAIAQAKELLSADLFTRLSAVDRLAKDKEALPDLILAFKRIILAALHASNAPNKAVLERYSQTLRSIYSAEAALKTNVNSKLLLTNLFLQM